MSRNSNAKAARTLLELVTIIVGVLIALGVDSWVSDQNDRDLERHYLESLARDLRADSTISAELFLPAMAQKEEALRTIAPIVRGSALAGDTIEFLQTVGLGGRLGTTSPLFIAIPTTHDELVATGNLTVIRSATLRAAIVNHYYDMSVDTDRLGSRIADYPMYVHRFAPAELRGDGSEAEWQEFGLRRALLGFQTPEFEALLNQEFNFLFMARRTLANAAQATNEMLRLVESELSR